MEHTCKHCGKRIVEIKGYSFSKKWVHKPEWAGPDDGYIVYCETTSAEPVDEDEDILNKIVSDNKKAFEEETKLANSILRRNRYNTRPPYQWYGPDPEPPKRTSMTREEFEELVGCVITDWQWACILEWRSNNG